MNSQLPGVAISTRAIDRLAHGRDASHYSLVPTGVATPRTVAEVSQLFGHATDSGSHITFRSGGTSLSGQGVSAGLLVDTRSSFRSIEILENGAQVRVQPGVTVRRVNAGLARFGRKLGPDPASEIACTIGGVIANNSSGMACGIEQNSYRTVSALTFVLPSGTVVDTSLPDADARLAEQEPDLHSGLLELIQRVRGSVESVTSLRRMFSMKNTMGYGLNSLLDFDSPVDALAHLVIGSEGTLAFVAEVVFDTVPVLPAASTGLAIFPTLDAATSALPSLVAAGFATIELLDATSLRVAQRQPDAPGDLVSLQVENHCALLLELQAAGAAELETKQQRVDGLLSTLDVVRAVALTTDAAARADLWHIRKGLYAAVAGARPSGTTALLEDIVVPVEKLADTCARLAVLFDRFRYEDSVIFGHAKDGNIHFLINERFEDEANIDRYREFTDAMVALVLSNGGSLKAEHGTGRVMAPFVRTQYGDELYEVMREIKRLCDPFGILNPGVVLTDDETSYLQNLKVTPTVEAEVDDCVECGYCESVCPSRDLTLTPRQRIVVRREMIGAEGRGDRVLLRELEKDYEYDSIETCAVDGMCQTACPVGINTGDLVRTLRASDKNVLAQGLWDSAARQWGSVTRVGGLALSLARTLPAPLVRGVTQAARAIVGPETIPLYSAELPSGGTPRKPHSDGQPEVVFMPSCIGTMFGPADGSDGSMNAVQALLERAGVPYVVPDEIASLCCGTPWKSKGNQDGYQRMSDRVLPALLRASREGKLAIVCDAASCSEGLETMRELALRAGGQYSALRFVDSIEFVHDRVLAGLTVTTPLGSIALHPTCSTTHLGINSKMRSIARAISADVVEPVDWGCCAFAGDRGLLHPELTAAATAREAHELSQRPFDAYASANRTCELGMTRATGHQYNHVLELLEQATRTGGHTKDEIG